MAGFEPGPANPEPFSAGGIHTQPAFDLIEVLPERAADRLRALRQRSSDAHAVIPEFADLQEANTAKYDAERALRRLTDHPHDGGLNLKPEDRRVIASQQHLAKMTADAKRLTELSEVRSAAWQPTSLALSAVEAWLKGGQPSGTVLQDHEAQGPKLNKGETVIDAIERHRRRGRELKADLRRIQSAPFPSSYAKQRMRAQIEALAQRGAPDVSSLIEHDREIAWPMMRLSSQVISTERALAFTEVTDTVAMMCWLHRDALIAALDREIASEADDPAALTHEVRQQREAKVMGDLLAVERDEAALVWQAQSERMPVEHRADISPLALLGLRLITAPRAVPSPGSSPEHAYDIVWR